MKTKLSPRFWLALSLFGLMGQIAWVVENMYLNVFIYKMFGASASDISMMVSASAIFATLTTVFIGALSDRIGKRKLFICGGYILWGISIFAFALLRLDLISAAFPTAASAASLGITFTIILDCVMTFFGSSANDAAYNAWLTDSTDSTNRGSAEGINSMMPLVAILAVFGGFMAFDLNLASSWTWIFVIIGVCVTIIGLLGIFLIKDSDISPSESGYLKNVIYGFLPSTVKAYPAFYFYLIAFIVFNISIQIFMPYLIIYYEVSLGMADYVLIMAPAIILASIVTAFFGRIYDKKGFGFSSVFSIIWLLLGYALLFIFRTTVPVFIGSLLMMCGYLTGMAVFGAKIRDLTPSGKAGMLQGVRIFSQVLIPGIVGPFIGKAVLANAEMIKNNDGTESFVPNANIFLAAAIPVFALVVLLLLSRAFKKPTLNKNLKTPFEDNSKTDWTEYPRPQMKRDSYQSLCGEWNLSLLKANKETEALGTIKVPFAPESRLSGIERDLKKGEKFIYQLAFTINKDTLGSILKKRVLLHFGAVDQCALVELNGVSYPEHIGGYLPFTVDVTDSIKDGKNTLTVTVTDNLDRELAYGKQRRDRGGMWYTPISGIWQAVWLEAVPHNHISNIRVTSDISSGTVTIDTSGGAINKTVIVKYENGERVYSYEGDRLTFEVEDKRLWTPESPYLYSFTISDGKDKVESYFALREISTKSIGDTSYICLNGEPYFFHGLLDQGYFSDGIYTPASPEGYIFDILEMKKLGFNMLRKHIKVEPELFYYYCDKYGMVVFQDMVNSGKYSFLIDTALPTAGVKGIISHRASKRRRDAFIKDSKEMIDLLYNHPSVCYYTIFNEGWGQFDADEMYKLLKAYDPTRIYDSTSGWFKKKKSDVTSEHVYFKPVRIKNDPSRPMILSEFGGYSCKINEHSFNLSKTYGYRFFKDRSEFEKALCTLYRNEIIPLIEKGLCATVLTQVSDVEDETNGIVTYDRQIIKVNRNSMLALSRELFERFAASVSETDNNKN